MGIEHSLGEGQPGVSTQIGHGQNMYLHHMLPLQDPCGLVVSFCGKIVPIWVYIQYSPICSQMLKPLRTIHPERKGTHGNRNCCHG